jgi:hypothetical protein
MKLPWFKQPWLKVSVDIVGPLPKTARGNEYILVFIDTFSGWTEAFAQRAKANDATGCVDKAIEVFTRWGFPSHIVSDNGPQFAARVWNEVMAKLDVDAVYTAPYHPQANPVERTNKNIKSLLRKFAGANHKRWDECLSAILFVLRTTTNESTGVTPARLLLGHELTAPVDLLTFQQGQQVDFDENFQSYAKKVKHRFESSLRFCSESRELAAQEQKLKYDAKQRHIEFRTGDLVLLQSHPLSDKAKGIAASLMPKREGPYIVLERRGPLTYLLGEPDTKLPVTFAHVVQLRRFYVRDAELKVAPTVAPPTEAGNKTDGNVASDAAVVPAGEQKKKPIANKPGPGLGKKRGAKTGPKLAVATPPAASAVADGEEPRVTRSSTASAEAADAAKDPVTDDTAVK